MLTGRRLVFVGGDARQCEVIAQTTEQDASATLVGLDMVNRSFTDTAKAPLSPELLASADAVILPVAGMDDNGFVQSQYAVSPIQFSETHFAAMRPETFVFTGIAKETLVNWCKRHQLRLVKLMELDDVAIRNSIPTAEGAIALAMQHMDITIHGSKAVVIGFGRCGMTLARTLRALGADVSVGARRDRDLARIEEMAMRSFSLPNQLDVALRDADVVFNTVPQPILTASKLSVMRRDAVIIDIASNPGGTDFRFAERRGITAVLAPSLPGLVAPKTAGKIIADTVCRLLSSAQIEN